ncbi:hypothetical protein IHI26_01950 [Candidatus Parvarchaeota archaeon]|nr:hypothetical protein [Candidatus Acidifodinimicrobium mancum]MBE5730074.1 hypothetical protein [Candidatus Acidifodinimicrobium mancum]
MNLYFLFEAGWGIFELLNVALVTAFSLFLVYVILKKQENKVLFFAWALDLKKSKRDMEILFTAMVIFFVVFSIFFLGELLNELSFVITSQILGLISYILVSYVILRWVKVFLRFVRKVDYAIRN